MSKQVDNAASADGKGGQSQESQDWTPQQVEAWKKGNQDGNQKWSADEVKAWKKKQKDKSGNQQDEQVWSDEEVEAWKRENANNPWVTDQASYPPLQSVILIMIALYCAVLLVALDRTIIATAIPRITDDFNSISDIGWYGSAYMLTASAFQLIYGRIYAFYSPKWVFLVAVMIFEVGSVICGAAPNSTVFIIGRAIAGLGAAGIFSGAMIIMVYTTPLQKRPMYTGFLAAIFGIASIVAPLLGGAFTDNVTWRWCFYINLPIGGLTMAIIIFILKLPGPTGGDSSLQERVKKLDPWGSACFLPGMVCLILALQWGGTAYPWNSGRIIVLLVLAGVLLITFVGVQVWKQEDATVPPRIFMKRSIWAGFWFATCVNGALIVILYYIPIWFQAIDNVSAVQSGIRNLPMVLALVVGSIVSGALVSNIGYYTPFMILCTILISVGSGLLATFTTTTDQPKWIGYQVIFGLGLGIGMQQPGNAAQTVLSMQDISVGVSLMFFGQSFGGALFISIAENVFVNGLSARLQDIANLDSRAIINVGATSLRDVVPVELLPRVLEAYNTTIVESFYVGVAASAATVLGSLFMEWKSVKAKQEAWGKKKDATETPSTLDESPSKAD